MTGLQSTGRVAALALFALARHALAAPELTPPLAAPHLRGQATTHTATHHLTRDDLAFLRQAARLCRLNVLAGELAVRQGDDPAVRGFGRRLLTDYQAADQQLAAIAGGAGIHLPSRPDAGQQRELDALRPLRGQAFDRTFVERVGIAGQTRAMDLFFAESRAASAYPQVREFARNSLPALRHHLQFAQNLQAHGNAAPQEG